MVLIPSEKKKEYNRKYREKKKAEKRKKEEELPLDNIPDICPVTSSDVTIPPTILPSEPPDRIQELLIDEDEYDEFLKWKQGKKKEIPLKADGTGIISNVLKAGALATIPQIIQILSAATAKTINQHTGTVSESSSSKQEQKPAGLSIAFS